MRSTFLQSLATAVVVLLAPFRAGAATYYVSPTGNDANAGTEAAPIATFAAAQTKAAAGDTVYFHGGTYGFSSATAAVGITLSKSGTASARIQYWAVPGEIPILDFSGLTSQQRLKGISLTGSYIHLKGFEVVNVRQNTTTLKESWAIRIEGGSNNILENLNVHDIMGPGIFIVGGGNNLILNCDSHHNYDVNSYDGAPTPGENADGFGCHSPGAGNVFRGCRAWWNSDDGYDFINSNGVCVAEHSWAWRNGFIPGTTTVMGNGAGFKGGGFTSTPLPNPIPRHRLLFNVSFLNRRQGFYANHQEGGIDWINNTAFNNGGSNFDMLADEGAAAHFLRNNLAAGTGGTVANLTAGEVDAANNSWNLSVTVTNADFLSVADTEAVTPRQADGSLPNVGFLHLAAGSDLIDKGVDAGFAYSGAAPDLGAFETGLVATGGATGTGGGASTGGAAARGGATSAGGTAGSGGVPAAGGVTSRGGTAGGTALGGSNNLGGAATAGAPASGGMASSGQAGATVGAGGASTGGAGIAFGGTGNGGTPSATGGALMGTQGGAFGTAGANSVAGRGGSAPAAGAASSNPGGGTVGAENGCSCRVPGANRGAASSLGLIFAALAGCGALVRRASRKRGRSP